MTDDPAEESLDPRAEAALRRALADARHSDPVPVDVAARLDDVLARLREGEAAAPVVDLEARRRRRSATRLLVAAAAVVVVGGVGARVFGPGPSGSDASTGSSASSADSGSSRTDGDPQREAAGGAAAESPMDSDDRSPLDPQAADGGSASDYSTLSGRGGTVAGLSDLRSTPALTESGFVRQVARLQAAAESLARSKQRLAATASVNAACGPGDYGDGTLVLVDYAGDPAVLAFRAPSGQTQVVDLLQCGSGDVVRSTTLERG